MTGIAGLAATSIAAGWLPCAPLVRSFHLGLLDKPGWARILCAFGIMDVSM